MLRLTSRAACTLTAALWCVSCGKPLSQSECEQLLDHYTDLLVQAYRPESTGPQRIVARASARAKAQRDPAFVQCSREVSRAAFECAMRAVSPDALEQCLL
jgi:hypothetical protein